MSKERATFTPEEKRKITAVVNDSVMLSIALTWIVIAGLFWYTVYHLTILAVIMLAIGAAAAIQLTFNEWKMRM